MRNAACRQEITRSYHELQICLTVWQKDAMVRML